MNREQPVRLPWSDPESTPLADIEEIAALRKMQLWPNPFLPAVIPDGPPMRAGWNGTGYTVDEILEPLYDSGAPWATDIARRPRPGTIPGGREPEWTITVGRWLIGDPDPAPAEPERDEQGRPRPPRPSTRPPMWANDPTRSRRTRNRARRT